MKFQVTFSDSSVNANSISLFIRYNGGERTKEISFFDALETHFENQVDFNSVVRATNWNSEFVVMECNFPLDLEQMYAGGYIVPVRVFFEKYFDQEIIDALLKEFAQEIREEMEERYVAAEEDIDVQAWKDYFRGLHI